MTIPLLILLGILLFGLLTGYREVQILCDRLSWQWENYRKNLYWFTDQNDKKVSNKDSFHVSNGVVFVLVALSVALNIVLLFSLAWYCIALVVPIWLFLFYVRNIFMHIIFKKKPLWGYLWKI